MWTKEYQNFLRVDKQSPTRLTRQVACQRLDYMTSQYHIKHENLSLNCEFSHRKVSFFLLLLLGLHRRLMLCQPPPNSTSFLWAQINRKVLLLAVSFTKASLLSLRDDGQNLCNRQPNHFDLRQLVGSASSNLGNPQGSELGLQLLQLAEQFIFTLGAELMHFDLGHRRNWWRTLRAEDE